LDGIADSSGNLSSCFDGSYSKLIPGYIVNFKFYSSSGTFLKAVTGTIPRFTVTKFDMLNAVISGTASAGKALDFFWSHPNLDAANTVLQVSKSGTASSTGKWSVDFGSQAMRGNDYFSVSYSITQTFIAFNQFWLPSLSCGIRSNSCVLTAIPNSSVSLSITHAGVMHTFTGKTDNTGFFYGYLVDGNQEPIFLSAGDVISGTGATSYKLPNLTAVSHPTTGKITGMAPANSYFVVAFRKLGMNDWNWRWVHSDSAGNYSADFSSVGIPTSPITIHIDHTNKVTGNHTFFYPGTGL
jgi:hypothetical protein